MFSFAKSTSALPSVLLLLGLLSGAREAWAQPCTEPFPIQLQIGARQMYRGNENDGNGLGGSAEARWKMWVWADGCGFGGYWSGGACVQNNSGGAGWKTVNYLARNQAINANSAIPFQYYTDLEGWENDDCSNCDRGNSCWFDFGNDDDHQRARTRVQNNRGIYRDYTFFDANTGGSWTGRANDWVGVRPISRVYFTDGNTTGDPINLGTMALRDEMLHRNGNGNENFGGIPYDDNIGDASPDVYYRFTLPYDGDVEIETDQGFTTFDTKLRLLNSGGGQIAENDDIGGGNTRSRIRRNLTAGTYYAVVEGWSTRQGNFELRMYVHSYNLPPSCSPTQTLTWTGNVNRDWNNGGNWSCNTVPGSGNPVIVPNRSNDPIIYNGVNANCYEIELQSTSGATLDIQGNGNLQIHR